jgi:uncharacterized protein YwgA
MELNFVGKITGKIISEEYFQLYGPYTELITSMSYIRIRSFVS